VFLSSKFLILREKGINGAEISSSGEENRKEGNFLVGVDSIETSNYANRQLKFFLYIPGKVLRNKEENHPLLVCVPGLSGKGERFAGKIFRDFADEEGFVIIAPSFVWDKENWNNKRSYQYPSVWSGNALVDIIDKVTYKYEVDFSGYYLFGHSAGAQFVLRYAIWESFPCVACAGYGSGGFVTPDESNYVSFLLGVGKKDAKRIEQAEWFYDRAKDLGIDVELKFYEGGHGLHKTFIKDALDLFKEKKKEKY
jgi:poly(3-hydroxybutyrate) depolymerase